MSWGGNTIARALALVAIATGAAFVDWGLRPMTLSLKAPGADGPRASAPDTGDTSAGGGTTDGAPAAGTPSDGEDEGAGVHADEPDAGAGTTSEPAARAFDPSKLGNEIGTADAFELWQTGTVAFIDARPAKDYEAGHIPFAYLVPAESIDKGRLGDMMEIAGVDPSWRVVVYCEGGTCDASHLVALTLQDMGFDKIHIDVDGFPAWQAAGHQVDTGPDQVLGDVP